MKNYQLLLEDILKNIDINNKPKLLIHSCCGPCSTYVFNYLINYFDITCFYFNPNIYPKEEYLKRKEEQKKVIKHLNISMIDFDYDESLFKDILVNNKDSYEGGQRCMECFFLRLDKTAQYAKDHNFDYFTTTLTVSPSKNSQVINEIGLELESIYNIKYLVSDFKKKEGYKKSIVYSKELDLYRQDYCGCIYSLQEKKN